MATQNPTTIPSRRAAIAAGLRGAMALVIEPAAAAKASPAPAGASAPALNAADLRVLQLWRRRRTVSAICERYDAAWKAANAQMPEWGRTGPKYVNRDGSPAGEELAGWPMVADPSSRPVDRYGVIDIRPSPDDLFREYQQACCKNDLVATSKFARALAELEQRRQERDAEEDRLGLSHLSDCLEDASRVELAIERQIERLIDASDLAVGAALILNLEHEADEDFLGLHRAALRALRPRLAGEIAEDADRVLRQGAEASG